MTKREIVAVALQLFGVFAVILAINMLQFAPTYISMIRITSSVSSSRLLTEYAVLFAAPLLMLAYAAVLILGSHSLAAWMAPEEGPAPKVIILAGPETQAIAFSVLGLAIFVGGMTGLVQALAAIGALPGDRGGRLWRFSLTQLPGPIVELVLGIALFRGADRLSAFWHARRGKQVEPPAETPEPRAEE